MTVKIAAFCLILSFVFNFAGPYLIKKHRKNVTYGQINAMKMCAFVVAAVSMFVLFKA